MCSLTADIRNQIDPEWIAARACEMVNIPSVTLHEQEICAYYYEQLGALGLSPYCRVVTPGRNNLYAKLPGTGGGPSLMLNGHLDTIPIGAAWPPRREAARLYGRGAADMKGGMAAILGAVRALMAAGVCLKGDVWIAAVVGHEEPEAKKDGPRALIKDIAAGLVSCDRILIAEGDPSLWIMSMGSTIFRITLDSHRGGAHTNEVPFDQNPIRFVGDLIQRIHLLQERLNGEAKHPLAGSERVDIGIVRGGDYFNRTPVRCLIEGTRRWGPGKTVHDVIRELEALASPIAQAGNLALTVHYEHEREPFETSQNDPAVRAAYAAALEVTGAEPTFVGRRIVGDANLFVHGTGLPTFYFGPGYESAHSDNEFVSLAGVHLAAQVYALTALAYCQAA
jgi:acetylornithine deacetylase/succinyl-diaminopimelate desuccinylase-like protein